MNLVDLIPGGRVVQMLVLAALAAALIGGITWAVHSYNESLRDEGRAEVQAKWNKEAKAQLAAALVEAETNAKESKRRLERQKESQDVHDAQTATLQAAAARVDADNGRLSGELAAFTSAACRSAGDAVTVCDRATAQAAFGVLAELYRSARTRAAVLGHTADAARTAGLQCERDYDTLTVKP